MRPAYDKLSLNDKEIYTIINALSFTESEYSHYAALDPTLKKQFEHQAREAQQMREMIERFNFVILSD